MNAPLPSYRSLTQGLVVTLVLFAALVLRPGFAQAERPNILYFYVDDMGWGSIGPNGQAQRKANGQPYVRTPNLDELAAQGINFTRGYGCHVCSPARSSQQSGFHQGHTFADRNDPNNAKKAMRADDVLIGDALSAAGYATGYWGKWGYGGSKDQVDPVIDNVQTLPTSHGYQHVLAELHHVRAHTFFQPTLWHAPASSDAIGGIELVPNSLSAYRNMPNYPSMPALQNDVDYPKTAYCDDAYAFAALDFVRAQGRNYNQSGQPFFGLLAVQIPHAPFGEISSLPDWDQAYADDPQFKSLADQTRQWAAMVTRIDAHFGNILSALEDPNHDGDTSDSVAENTLVVFQSDNGGPSGSNRIELDANGGLRGTKGQIQEGGIRVPLVMRWPAKIRADSALKAGTHSKRVVDVTDLLPTFCDLAGAPIPLGIDGVSIAPTLLSEGHQRKREFIIHEASNGQSIIRGNHKLIQSKKSSLQLYDLEADRAETNDIAADHPEIVKELEALLLGERVTEPAGFANTYHRWTGSNGATTSNPNHWSDYAYTNAGITYLSDDGAPRLSWTALIENAEDESNTALADKDLEFLGLEIRGNQGKPTTQSLVLGPSVNLTGRNEIRVASNAMLTVNDGTVSSLRWIDIHAGGTLNGSGTIDATLYNHGTVAPSGTNQPNFKVLSDYHQSALATLRVALNGKGNSPLRVVGEATLSGTLAVDLIDSFQPSPGKTYSVLTAKKVSGEFSNPGNIVVAADGTRFTINYKDSAVVLLVN
ncbi:sulfatase-like hydrolase/transferase [Novipirellula artificiosorum]|uniref:Arylsulfatase n=1 Tax=Novipirellula artificiosorum TaxID=2528016 RepID=A0A5C6CZA1_9BACT|nr:sulfatase-like hydrolase/transferase [Novipirellula artificiosorum]TWU28827.1 Arylsulfatase precursor [Novipirellula artificiosorum]